MWWLFSIALATKAMSASSWPLVLLDPGHGGEQTGAVGVCGLREKDLTLLLAKETRDLLEATGRVRVRMTRSYDVDVELHDRAQLANDASADVFVSIHANASTNPRHRGIETYFLSRRAADRRAQRVAERENGLASIPTKHIRDPVALILHRLSLEAAHVASQRLALKIHRPLSRMVAEEGRGVLQAPFVVLHGTHMAAILVEVGFLTNGQDCQQLATESYQRQLALALTTGILTHLGHEGLFWALGPRAPNGRELPCLPLTSSGQQRTTPACRND